MDDGTFKVGEIGILQNLIGWPGRYNGEEALIIGGLEQRPLRYLSGKIGFADCYLISVDGQDVAVHPVNLRKKRPPHLEHASPREVEVA